MIRLWLRRLTGVDRKEIVPVLLMGSYGFLAMTSYYLIKPARNSVFVDRVGANNLPYIYILTAVVVTAVVVVYSRYVERIGERKLLLGTFAVLVAGLVFFWWLLSRDTSFWSSGAFYIWGKLYPLLLVSQFWLVGNLVFTTRQGRRLFAVVGMGLILGGIAGSAVTGTFASVVGTEYLLLIAAGTLVLCGSLCAALFPRMRSARGAGARLLDEFSGDALRILARSAHLRSIAGILALTILAGTLVDWQLNRAVELAIPTEDGKTRFWGFFFMALNITSVSIQAVFTGWVLRRWGVGVAVLVLPVALLVATVGVLAAPVLLVVALAKGTEGALRYSLDQSTREVLYLPVPAETKYKVKPLIDLAVYRGGTGLGGVVLLLAVQGLGFGIREVALVTGLVILGWVAVAVRMRGEYVESLARSIRGRFAHLDPAAAPLAEASALRMVGEALRERDPVECAYALDLLDEGGAPAVEAVAGDVAGVLDHPEPEVRARALEVLALAPDAVPLEAVEARLRDPDPGVRESAVRALCRGSEQPPDRTLRKLVASPEVEVRVAALRCLAGNGLSVDGAAVVERSYLEERWSGAGEERDCRLEVALAAGALGGDDAAVRYLEPLLADDDGEVAAAAIRSAGRVRRAELLPGVVAGLGRSETRSAARETLVATGEEGIRALEPVLLDERADPSVRRRVPEVLGRIPLQESVNVLCRLLESGARDGLVERRALRALGTLQERGGKELRIDAKLTRMVTERQLEAAEAYGVIVRNLEEAGKPGLRADSAAGREADVDPDLGLDLLLEALREARRWRLEALFRCLSILHPSTDVDRAHRAVVDGDGELRSNALEWLEHTLPREQFALLAPALAQETGAAGGGPDGSRPELDALLFGLWHDDSPTVASLALWASARRSPPAIVRRLRIFREDAQNPAVRRVAALLLEELTEEGEEESDSLDPVERAVLLRHTELLAAVGPTPLLAFADAAAERAVEAGSRVVSRGEPAPGLHVVAEGRIELELADGRRRALGPGEAFGAASLLDPGPSPVGARALEPCRLLLLPSGDFRELLQEDGELGGAVLAELGRRMPSVFAS